MGFNTYVGSTSYDLSTGTWSNIGTQPDFSNISYTATTYLPGELLVDALHRVAYDTSNNTPIQLSNGYSFNFYDVPVDVGMNRCDLSSAFSTSSGASNIMIDEYHPVPFDKSIATIASVIPKVFGKQFPFTQSQDTNVRNLVPEATLVHYSKFSLREFGFYSQNDAKTVSLQALIRSRVGVVGNVLDGSNSADQQGHRIIDGLYDRYTNHRTNCWTTTNNQAVLHTLPDAVNLQFVLRLSLSHENVNMNSNPNFLTPFDNGSFANRALILYNFVFVPDISVPALTVASGSTWTATTTLANNTTLMSANTKYRVHATSANVFYHSVDANTTQEIDFQDADILDISRDGTTVMAGILNDASLNVYRNREGTMNLIYTASTYFPDRDMSDNGSRIVLGSRFTNMVSIIHLQHRRYKNYFLKQYSGAGDTRVRMSASGDKVMVLNATERRGAYIYKIYTLTYDGQNWHESEGVRGLITTVNDRVGDIDISADTGLVVYSKQTVDVRTDPETITRSVVSFLNGVELPTIDAPTNGDATFGRIIKVSRNALRFAVAGDNDTRVFGYNGSSWSQVGATLPLSSNITLSVDGGTILVENKIYTLS